MRIGIGTARVGFGLLMIWLSKMFIDVTIRTGSESDIILMIILLIITVLAGILLRQAYYYMTVLANTRQTNYIRLNLFKQLLTRQLYNGQDFHSGDITSRMAKDIEIVSEASTSSIPQMIITSIQITGAFILMYTMDKTLAWCILIISPFAITFGKLISNHLRKMSQEIRDNESNIQMQIQECVELNDVVRALNSENWVTSHLQSAQQELRINQKQRARFVVYMRIVFGAVFGLGYLLAFIWGGLQLRAGAISFGVMTSFLQLVGQIQQPILTLLNTFTQLIHASASINRLKELETESLGNNDNVDEDNSNEAPQLLGVRIRQVSYHYETSEHAVFNNFSYEFAPGSKTAIMGTTGIGKTTLFRLMLALTKPNSGTMSLYAEGKEIPINTMTRKHFIFVPQGNTLISGSIRHNLLMAKPSATDDELKKVLNTAVSDFVFDLPEGLDTILGEHGKGLSEGQAQRIAIARGLLRPGSILLLDEISSSLDENTELQLYNRLFSNYPHHTMIFITHRSSVCNMCDSVINLEKSNPCIITTHGLLSE